MTIKMRNLKFLWIGAIGAVLVIPAVPVAAGVPVTVDFDSTGFAGWVAQAANMGKTIAADSARYIQLEKEIVDADTELKQLQSMAHSSTGSMQSFTNFVVTSNNRYPTAAGGELAKAIVAAQNGSLSSGTIASLTNEALATKGGLQAQAAQEDVELHILTTGQNSTMFNSEQSFATIIEYLGIATIGAFVFIAVELVMAYLQVYLVLPVAAFTLGFLGSPATRSFGTGYWQAVIQALVRFTTILFVIGFALTLADTYRAYFATIVTAQIPTAGTPDITFKGAITAAGLSFALLYIVRVLPSMFMSIVSGAAIGAEGSTGNFEYQGSNALQSGRVGRRRGPAARNTSGRLNTPGAPSSYP